MRISILTKVVISSTNYKTRIYPFVQLPGSGGFGRMTSTNSFTPGKLRFIGKFALDKFET